MPFRHHLLPLFLVFDKAYSSCGLTTADGSCVLSTTSGRALCMGPDHQKTCTIISWELRLRPDSSLSLFYSRDTSGRTSVDIHKSLISGLQCHIWDIKKTQTNSEARRGVGADELLVTALQWVVPAAVAAVRCVVSCIDVITRGLQIVSGLPVLIPD